MTPKSLLFFSVCHPLWADVPPIPNWKMIHSLDSDHSGQISLSEFHSSKKIFTFIDSNKDGLLSKPEVRAAEKLSPPPPEPGENTPLLSALDPQTGKPVNLFNRERPFALIFGTHT